MPININGPTSTQVDPSKTRQSQSSNGVTPEKSGNGTESASTEDVVQLSDKARVMKAVESRIQNMPDVDQDKVDRIRNALSNGEYKIDFDKLADAFRRFESGL
ncbi:flagellar biosynthesis anti-sigma factor FlgM [Reinekea marina]|uniref:Anti-sigma-28 factor n=1 Tax=Reinekea marina TaxID=1310421 RepID=A0ABV7WWP0_9GAMM|nr:flagellar biosynthesis anti-sigma factor FlgM [Reinekea marina]MBU2862234.1 flagellar biosynthesis anti-sigma factor FlgM [Reinekea forsetii]MDN3649781.1 flagellar biosynthesis anti-sigma factor FlgM [Reinekea marina]